MLAVSPAPDDALVAAGGTLVGLAATGACVVELSCAFSDSAGRAEHRRRLRALCARAGFVPDGAPLLAGTTEPGDQGAVMTLVRRIRGALLQHRPDIVVAPSPGSPAPASHALVGRAVRAAVAPIGGTVWWWSMFGRDMPPPALVSPVSEAHARTVVAALAEYDRSGSAAEHSLAVERRWTATAAISSQLFPSFGAAGRVEILREATCEQGKSHLAPSRLLTEPPTAVTSLRAADFPYEWLDTRSTAESGPTH